MSLWITNEDAWLPLVVTSHRQEALRAQLEANGRDILVIVRCEPENPHDLQAVVVVDAKQQYRLGYVPKDIARDLYARLQATGAVLCPGRIEGGTGGAPLAISIDGDFLRRSFNTPDGRPAMRNEFK